MTLSLILDLQGAIARDTFHVLGDAEPLPDLGDVAVPLARFVTERPDAAAHKGRLAVLVPADGDALALAGALAGVAAVFVELPSYRDGRAYSHARHVRDVLGFEGEVRAVGDVGADHVFHLRRCGVDAFALREGEDPERARRALTRFSVSYAPATWAPAEERRAAE